MRILFLITGFLFLTDYDFHLLTRDTYSGAVSSFDSPWPMHSIDPNPAAGSDGVKLADVNDDGFPDLVSGFEEGGVSRIYIHPGYEKLMNYWAYVELPSPDVEDALLIDLDNDGNIDLVTASEGMTNQIVFHWAPDKPSQYLDACSWLSDVVPVMDDRSAWMFVVPADMDGENGMDLIVGSKRKRGDSGDDRAIIGWLRCPANPRQVSEWEFFPISSAGWIMSIDLVDMDNDGLTDILISDRKFSSQTGVRWLKNPGPDSPFFYREWESVMVGVQEGEPMFLARADLDGDGQEEIIVPDLYTGITILKKNPILPGGWEEIVIPYPAWAGNRGKAVQCEDIDGDGNPEVVLSFEEEGNVASIPFSEYKKQGKYSVIGAKLNTPGNLRGEWTFFKISGFQGRKFDLVNLIDLDGDGDLDVLTNDENEEGDGLGVVWYENPLN